MPKPKAFVIMPFAEELRPVYEDLICSALADYEVDRADTRLDERGILEKIITGIRDADLVIADLTSANANVMYELGVAHAMGKPTIMIAQSVGSVPFDIRAYPVHEYSTHFARASELTRTLRELGERHRAGELLFANPVTDFTPDLAELPQPSVSALVYSFDQLHHDIENASNRMGRFGEDFAAASSVFHQRISLVISRAATGTPERKAALNDAADVIRELGMAMDNIAVSAHEAWQLYGRATAWLLAPSQLAQIPPESRSSFATSARNTDATLNGMIADIATLREANDQLPRVSGNLRHAVEVTHDSLTRLLNEIMTGKAHLARAISGFATVPPSSA